MKKQISCGKTKRAIQDALDRGEPISPAQREQFTQFLPGEVRSHLERCPDCRDYLYSLGTFASLLRSQLDESLQDYPDPDFTAFLGRTGRNEIDLRLPSPGKQREAGIPAAFQRFRSWLFAPAGKPAAVYRWAAVSALALLAASLIGFRIYSVSATHRAIRQQIDRVVELIYRDPLLPGIESALLRTQPDISDYVEDLNRAIDNWLEEAGSESYLN